MANLNIPKASTPGSVIFTTLVLMIFLGCLMFWVFQSAWGIILTFVILAFTTTIYTQNVEEYHALTLLNKFTGKQRVLFQGRTGKFLWEEVGTLVDLRAELKDIPEETWATGAGALMDAKYVYILHPRATEKGILAYASFTRDTVKAAARNLFSIMLSDHFGKCKKPEKLLGKDDVNKAVFETPEGKDKICKFEEEYGVICSSVKLEDVDFDAETQKARDVISKAESMAKATEKLIKAGWSPEVAEKTIRMSNIPGIQEYILSLDAKGLENMTSVVFGGGFPGGKK